MFEKEVTTDFIAAHLSGATGAKVNQEGLESYNGKQRVTGGNDFAETTPEIAITGIVATLGEWKAKRPRIRNRPSRQNRHISPSRR